MTLRPLYRWKSFWLGLLVLVFFGWAWRDSCQKETMIVYDGAAGTIQFGRTEGVTYIAHGPRWIAQLSLARPYETLTFQRGSGATIEWWKNAWDTCRSDGVRYWVFLDSLVFFSILGLWSGWLAWRWRRIKRLDASR